MDLRKYYETEDIMKMCQYMLFWNSVLALKAITLCKIFKIIREKEVLFTLKSAYSYLMHLILNHRLKHAIGYAFMRFREDTDCGICYYKVENPDFEDKKEWFRFECPGK